MEIRFIIILTLIRHLKTIKSSLEADDSGLTHSVSGSVTSPLQLITQMPDSSDIFVASGSTLCKFSENGTLLANTSLPYGGDSKVLLVDPRSNNGRYSDLLYCGTANRGQCHVFDAYNLSLKGDITDSSDYAYLGSNASVVALFSDTSFYIDKKTTIGQILYVAQEKTNETLETPILSSRQLNINQGGFKIDLIRNGESRRRMDIYRSYRDSYKVQYLYGFTYSNFIFFLSVQKSYFNTMRPTYRTYLTRVCKDDYYYDSVAEIELQCATSGQVDDLARYNIAEAAYMQNHNNQSHLFVAFGKSENGASRADRSGGSGICRFAMLDIQRKYYEAFHECYNGTGKLSPWLHKYHRRGVPCFRDTFEKDYIEEHPLEYCYDPYAYNHGVGFGHKVVAKTLVTLGDEYVTAVAARVQNDKQVVIAGTENGHINKLALSENDISKYKSFDLDSGRRVSRQLLLSEDGILHVLVNNAMVRVDVASCGVYGDCVSCVTSGDPLQCGWCDGRCTEQSQCTDSSKDWLPDMCPVEIFEVEPLVGPVSGGTLVTLIGAHLGNWTVAPNVQITLGDIPCYITNLTHDRVTCLTLESSSEANVSLVVSSTSANQDALTSLEFGQFTFKTINMTSVGPFKGPISGGTEVVIMGMNLDIGTSVSVSVAGHNCEITQRQSDKMTCTTQSLKSIGPNKKLTEGPVFVSIDNFEMTSQELFIYKPDPEISSVSPNKSIASGGTLVTVKGRFLDSVAFPFLVIKNAQINQQANVACTVQNNGTQMTCPIPALNKTLDDDNPTQPTLKKMFFHMDGVQDSTRPFNYFVDPIIFEFAEDDKTRRLLFSEDHIKIMGKYLNLGCSQSDFNVKVGEHPCEISKLFEDRLFCRLDRAKHSTQAEAPKMVVVSVGYMAPVIVGYLDYKPLPVILETKHEAQSARKPMYILVPVSILSIAVLIVMTMIAVFRRRKSKSLHRLRDTTTTEWTVRYSRAPVEVLESDQERYSTARTATRARQSNGGSGIIGSNVLRDTSGEGHRAMLEATGVLIDCDRLQVLEEVGKGQFGCVNRGLLTQRTEKEELQVAVKTMKTVSDHNKDREIYSFLEEALRMKDFCHNNILTLIGIALDESTDMPLVVLPFMEHGDLLTYLRDERNMPMVKTLLMFGMDIAHGMDYLANLKFVHRDLAARNCMLNQDMQVVVADFGLSRDIYESQYYSSSDKQAKLPIKWMAPESIENRLYDTKSDVWSFGVVLWELMTRGQQPYPGVDNWDVLRYLRTGRRMDQPEYCPECIYDIMQRCWMPDPSRRPIFAEIVRIIQDHFVEVEASTEQGAHDEIYLNVPNPKFCADDSLKDLQHGDSNRHIARASIRDFTSNEDLNDYFSPSQHYFDGNVTTEPESTRKIISRDPTLKTDTIDYLTPSESYTNATYSKNFEIDSIQKIESSKSKKDMDDYLTPSEHYF